MLTFEQFLYSTAEKGRSINTLFEERLFALVGTLERIAGSLAADNIPYEVIGGMAVMLQVHRVDPSAVRNTKDIDIMIQRADLERIKGVAEQHGFRFRHSAGVDMLLPRGETKARSGVHLVFSGEKVRPHQVLPNPLLRPEHLSLHGVEVAVIPVADLVRMKLSSNRDIDRVHIRDLDTTGLITAKLERGLPSVLRARLREIRRQE
ncbi:MAG TPA: nucleotidyltransferase family protein [Terriglobia bacterium]|nr:nucleotidyltransferase family protein [Terriglobia bacterium]